MPNLSSIAILFITILSFGCTKEFSCEHGCGIESSVPPVQLPVSNGPVTINVNNAFDTCALCNSNSVVDSVFYNGVDILSREIPSGEYLNYTVQGALPLNDLRIVLNDNIQNLGGFGDRIRILENSTVILDSLIPFNVRFDYTVSKLQGRDISIIISK
jgi:hypothetical protein